MPESNEIAPVSVRIGKPVGEREKAEKAETYAIEVRDILREMQEKLRGIEVPGAENEQAAAREALGILYSAAEEAARKAQILRMNTPESLIESRRLAWLRERDRASTDMGNAFKTETERLRARNLYQLAWSASGTRPEVDLPITVRTVSHPYPGGATCLAEITSGQHEGFVHAWYVDGEWYAESLPGWHGNGETPEAAIRMALGIDPLSRYSAERLNIVPPDDLR